MTAEADPPRTREDEILAVASTHLNTMGVSVDWFSDIADTLGLTRPALYKYFADREDLQFRCYLRTCDELERRFRAAQTAAAAPVDLLLRFVTDTLRATPELAVMSELFALRTDQRRVIEARQDALVAVIAAEIRRGAEAGAIRPVDAPLLAQTLLGLASWPALLARWGAGGDRGRLVAGATELLLRGLAAQPHAEPLVAAPLTPLDRRRPDLFSRADIHAAKREGVLIAASALFNRRGIGATRIEDVAEALKLSKRAVYHYVGQKQDLVDACVERSYAHALAVMAAAERFAGSRLQALAASIRDVVVASADPAVCVMVPYVGYGQVSPAEQAAVRGHVAAMTEGYRRLLEAGVREGSIRDTSLDAVQMALPGLFCWTANAEAPDVAEVRRRADGIADLVARGILA